MAENDFDAVNRLAMEQVNRLAEGGSVSSPVPYKTARTSFWDEDSSKLHSKYSPSEASVPLYGGSTYRGTTYLGTSFLGGKYESGATETERFYRRTLNAVYRSGESRPVATTPNSVKIEVPEIKREVERELKMDMQKGEEQKMEDGVFGSGLFSGSVSTSGHSVRNMIAPRIPVSNTTKNQLTAIVLSGITRMASTAVLNWAKDRQVPYELL